MCLRHIYVIFWSAQKHLYVPVWRVVVAELNFTETSTSFYSPLLLFYFLSLDGWRWWPLTPIWWWDVSSTPVKSNGRHCGFAAKMDSWGNKDVPLSALNRGIRLSKVTYSDHLIYSKEDFSCFYTIPRTCKLIRL